jgi:hypothetical protein
MTDDQPTSPELSEAIPGTRLAHVARTDGILDEVTGNDPPPALGPCSGLTLNGSPCQNKGTYWVNGNLSCSRGHHRYARPVEEFHPLTR